MSMTVRDVADALGVSERSVWRWSAGSVLPPPVRVGRSVRWSRKTIEQWLADRETEALAEEQRLRVTELARKA